jgi:hypothetical protein
MYARSMNPSYRRVTDKTITSLWPLLIVACAASWLLWGCATIEQAERAVRRTVRPLSAAPATPAAKRTDQITENELEQLTYGFADRYFTYIITATENIERNNANAVQRRRAHQVRLVQVSAIYDIATNADPFTRLLDFMLVVTLQSQKWIEDDQAERWFGERAQPLIYASRKAREDIWQIAARTMTTEQLEVIDYLIWDWRRRNPGIELVSYVRFDDFAAARGKSVIADVKSGGGMLAPVGEATKAVDEMRMLGERAFFYAKRLPFLVNWQMRAAIDDVLTDSEARELSSALLNASRTLARLPQDLGREREAILAMLSGEGPMLQSATSQYRGAVGDTTALVRALTGLTSSSQRTLETLDRVVSSKNGQGDRFDIREYDAMLEKILATLQEANRLAAATALVIGSMQPEQFDRIAKGGSLHAQTVAQGVIDGAFWRAVVILVIFFVLLALYRVLSVKLDRRVAGK